MRMFGNAPYIESFRVFSSVSWEQWEDFIAPKYKAIILDAAQEQGIHSEPTYLDLYADEVA